jgi:hypothetical protein
MMAQAAAGVNENLVDAAVFPHLLFSLLSACYKLRLVDFLCIKQSAPILFAAPRRTALYSAHE